MANWPPTLMDVNWPVPTFHAPEASSCWPRWRCHPTARAAVARALCEYLAAPALPSRGPGAATGRRNASTPRAQETLASRARPGGWPDLSLDLSGATLVDLDSAASRSHTATSSGAQFHGQPDFSDAVFERADSACPARPMASRRSTARPSSRTRPEPPRVTRQPRAIGPGPLPLPRRRSLIAHRAR